MKNFYLSKNKVASSRSMPEMCENEYVVYQGITSL